MKYLKNAKTTKSQMANNTSSVRVINYFERNKVAKPIFIKFDPG